MAQQNAGQLAVVALIVGAAIGVALAVGALGISAPDADSTDNGQPNGSIEPTDNQSPTTQNPGGQTWNGSDGPSLDGEASIGQFGSTDAFREYVRAGQRRANVGWRVSRPGRFRDDVVNVEFDVTSQASDGGSLDSINAGESTPTDTTVPDRIGNTNVQVEGLDEPDIVKTDGRNFYYSPESNRYVVEPMPQPVEPGGVVTDEFVPPRQQQERDTHVVDASEPADPAVISNIDANGELLQTGDRLVVFDEAGGEITGYDVSDPENPIESWALPLNSSLVTVRETGGQLYVVTRTGVGPNTDCPIAPLGSDEAIACGDIYAPNSQTSASTAYTTFSIDAASGAVEDSVSMMGTGENTVVYMSENGLYVTYTTHVSEVELFTSWADSSDLVPEELTDRIAEIDSYDISQQSKRTEMQRALQEWSGSLSDEAKTTLTESFADYRVSQQENLTQTTVVSVDVENENLLIGETGTVPGEPLNQFALDEYQGTLRITTTIPRVAGQDSDNHLYVLDNETLDRESRVTGMGHDQRVYSVRYVGDTAYVVTFRQVDPFYVIDFESPTEPELLSELELPGFSSYLHPINDNYVLGIGEENGRVKSVLFDVTDPTDTSVADDLVLDEYTSAIDSSHHAFMIDRRHEVFFLPTGNSAKIVDYTDGELEVVTEVSTDEQVTRARYVDDHLYVFAGNEIIVLDQTNWERTTTLSLDDR